MINLMVKFFNNLKFVFIYKIKIKLNYKYLSNRNNQRNLGIMVSENLGWEMQIKRLNIIFGCYVH